MSDAASSARRNAPLTATVSSTAKTNLIGSVASQLQAPGADTKPVERTPVPAGHAQPEIAHGCFARGLKVPVPSTGTAACSHDRKRTGSMNVRISHPAAVNDERVVEQRAVTV